MVAPAMSVGLRTALQGLKMRCGSPVLPAQCIDGRRPIDPGRFDLQASPRRWQFGGLNPMGHSKTAGTAELNKALRRLTKDRLIGLVEDLCRTVPAPALRRVLGRHVNLSAVHAKPRPDPPERLIRDVRAFHSASLAGDYYEPFPVNSSNFTMKSDATVGWGEDCEALLKRCEAASEGKRYAPAREAFDLLLDLLERIDVGEDIVFFADEGGAWEVADLDPIWPAYFMSLAPTATPDEYAARVGTLLRRHGSGQPQRLLRPARRAASREQRRQLPNVASALRAARR